MYKVDFNLDFANDWLTERYQITKMTVATEADITYLNGAFTMLRALGLDYIINDGKVTILGAEEE